jgi:hypothetical protein
VRKKRNRTYEGVNLSTGRLLRILKKDFKEANPDIYSANICVLISLSLTLSNSNLLIIQK